MKRKVLIATIATMICAANVAYAELIQDAAVTVCEKVDCDAQSDCPERDCICWPNPVGAHCQGAEIE